MRILVTGAMGFLGAPICSRALEKGHFVRALVRPESKGRAVSASEVAVGNLCDLPSLHAAVQGADGVIHAAGVTSEKSPSYATFYQTNVEGTSNLLKACREAGVSRLIAIGSLSAKQENTGYYGATKLQSEKLITASGLEYTVIRPAFVYGPGKRGLFKKMLDLIKAFPLVPVVGSGNQLMRPVYVFDVAAAVMKCLDKPESAFQAYDLGGEANITFNEFIEAILGGLGRKKPLLHIPVWSLIPVVWAFQLLLKNPPMTRDNLIGIVQSAAVDNTKSEEELGFRPTPLRQGLEASLADS